MSAVRPLLRAGLAVLRTELGRRLATVAVISTVLVAGVSALYDHADPVGLGILPASARTRSVAATRPDAPAARPPSASRRPSPPKRPDQVAVAWYATRRGIVPGKVKALQQQRLGADRVRVLVMAEVGRDRLDTALVTVRRQRSGWVVR